MPTVTKKQVTTEKVRIQPKIQRQLLTELHAYNALATEQKALKKGMDEHRTNILDIGTANLEPEQYKFEIEGYKVALVTEATDSRLDKVKLLKLLITDGHYTMRSAEKLLERSTVTKPKKSYARVTCPGEEGE